jgi:hypothetical protein
MVFISNHAPDTLEGSLMAQKITIRDLIMLTGFENATINFLAPFSEDVEVMLDYGGGRKEKYEVYVSAEDQPLFSKWIVGRVQSK